MFFSLYVRSYDSNLYLFFFLELSLGNLVRRVLNIIREAYSEIALENNKETNLEDSSNMRERMERVTSLSTLTSMVVSNSLQDEFLGQFDKQLRDRVNEDIGELIQAELENSVNLISEYAQDHIHTKLVSFHFLILISFFNNNFLFINIKT